MQQPQASQPTLEETIPTVINRNFIFVYFLFCFENNNLREK